MLSVILLNFCFTVSWRATNCEDHRPGTGHRLRVLEPLLPPPPLHRSPTPRLPGTGRKLNRNSFKFDELRNPGNGTIRNDNVLASLHLLSDGVEFRGRLPLRVRVPVRESSKVFEAIAPRSPLLLLPRFGAWVDLQAGIQGRVDILRSGKIVIFKNVVSLNRFFFAYVLKCPVANKTVCGTPKQRKTIVWLGLT
jgi:hypothetical protein